MTQKIGCYIRSDAGYERIKHMLEMASYECQRFPSENTLLRMTGRRNLVMLIIDIGTDLSAAEWFSSWLNCRSGDRTPIIALSGAASPDLSVLALDSGADDFLHMHFEPVEALARIRAAIRRSNPVGLSRTIALEGFVLDREASRISYDNEVIELTPREFTMAWLFFSSPGIYISRSTIGSTIWSADSEIAGRTIEQHVYKLRKKLELGPERKVTIRTAYSQGYRLEIHT